MKKIIVLDMSDIRVKKNGDKYNITPESNIEIIMSEEAMSELINDYFHIKYTERNGDAIPIHQ